MESRLLIRCHVQQAGIKHSSSGRQRFWYVHFALAPKLIIYSFAVAVQQWLSVSNPSELSLQPRFRSAREQLRLHVKGMRWQHMQGRYFLLDTSRLPGSGTSVTLQVLLDESRALLKYSTENETLNVAHGGMSSNASCIMSCLCPLTQRASSSSQTFEVLDGCHEGSACTG